MLISFKGQPINYRKIDNYVSRSAQPYKEDFQWLKEQGVTDVINFRTMIVPEQDFDEKAVVESNGMKYHHIPSKTSNPQKENITRFLNIVEDVKKNNGKVHIHCMAGADRTGMYSLIYKETQHIGNYINNKIEMCKMGHNYNRFPNLLSWIDKFLKKS